LLFTEQLLPCNGYHHLFFADLAIREDSMPFCVEVDFNEFSVVEGLGFELGNLCVDEGHGALQMGCKKCPQMPASLPMDSIIAAYYRIHDALFISYR
jgi:hypothetical protein